MQPHFTFGSFRQLLFGSLIVTLLLSLSNVICAQGVKESDRRIALEMLKKVKEDLKKNYYDPNFRGINLEARCKEAEERIAKADMPGQLAATIAQVLLDFEDAGTWFYPPYALNIPDYGFDWNPIGAQFYVTAIKPNSDAEAKGLKVGDRILKIAGYEPTRKTAWQLRYGLTLGRPQNQLVLEVQGLDSKPRQVVITSQLLLAKKEILLDRSGNNGEVERLIGKIEKQTKTLTVDLGDDTLVVRAGLDAEDVFEKVLGKSRKYNGLILDLRGISTRSYGPAAAEVVGKALGYFFEQDVKFCDLKTRKGERSVIAKSKGKKIYAGKLVVLVDGITKDAFEVFARVIQLERRGTIVGDRTGGATRLSTIFYHEMKVGLDSILNYHASITDTDIFLPDGQTIEGVGLTPDHLILPTQEDLAAGRDPSLAYAAKLLGETLTPERAGTLFPKTGFTIWTNL